MQKCKNGFRKEGLVPVYANYHTHTFRCHHANGTEREYIEQAIERAGTKAGNKGYDCAVSAIEMVNLIREMDAE